MQQALYPMQPKQLEFANTFAKYRLYGGAKGGGKSYAMRAECVRQCLSAKKVRGLVLRRTNPEIIENMVDPMRKELPLHLYKYNGSSNKITFYNGSTLRFSYCDSLADVLKYQGVEYDFICIEELTHWREDEFKMLMTSLRSTRKGIFTNFFGSTNPGGKGHAWVKRLFVKREFTAKEKPEEYAFISAKVWDNAVLMDAQPEYVEALEALPEVIRKAYLEGDWDVFQGQFFKEFRDYIHIIPPVVPAARRRIIVFDYGYVKPSAVYWLAEDSQGQVTVYRELYVTGHTYIQLAAKIKAMTPENEKIEIVLADPAIVNKDNDATGTSGSEEMIKAGLSIKGANNRREAGWQMFRKYLQPFEDPNSGAITARLKITENCSELIRTLPELIHDKVNVEDLDSSGEDHAADAIRYGLMYLGANLSTLDEVKASNDLFRKHADYQIENAVKRHKEQKRRSQNILYQKF